MPARTDIAVGMMIAVLGAAIILMSRDLHPIVGASFGPGLFPTILGGGMIVGGLLLGAQALMAQRQGVLSPERPETAAQTLEPARPRPKYAALAWTILGTLASIWLLAPVGFVLYCTVLLAGMMILLRVRPWSALALALPLSVGVYLVFVHLLLVPLPVGTLFTSIG